jgi:hypothetical protein
VAHGNIEFDPFSDTFFDREGRLGPCAISSKRCEGLEAHAEAAVDGDHGTGDVGGVIVDEGGNDVC